MTDTEYRVARYDGAVRLLPWALRERARRLPGGDRERAEELRLREGQPLTALLPEGEVSLGGEPVTKGDLQQLVELCTGASVHSAREQLRRGFVTVRGGYRVGLCGSVFLSEGQVAGFGSFTSAAVRVSREHRGVAEAVMAALTAGGFRSTLIVAPPGAGKTTLLRDVTARLSDGGLRVSLADERGEVAAAADGAAQFYVGRRTDVLDGCPKAQAVLMLLRAMNPQVIALDEITAPEDAEAVRMARNCGVALLATAHGAGLDDLRQRPLYRPLLEERVFQNVVTIRLEKGRRIYEVIRGDDL